MKERKFHIGAEVLKTGGVNFRVWAPGKKFIELITEGRHPLNIELENENNGYFSITVDSISTGTLYKFRIDKQSDPFPDPASRFQPRGVHGPSEVIDPNSFKWGDWEWKGVKQGSQILYEMHIGTFTKEGTFKAAQEELKELANIGITVIELMPVADFYGEFGWGYDGVDLFAPCHLYGRPDDFKSFINEAHSIGISVILDVVYNHLGPEGNYISKYSDFYFTDKYKTDWGQAVNFDGKNSQEVREFFLANAGYWIDEYHLDGLRLDATQDINDDSEEHILYLIGKEIKESAAGRNTFIVAENEPQDVRLVKSKAEKGYELDALWNDDFHHSAMVALTGHNEAYYTDYLGKPQEFISALKYGYLYQGQWYKWQSKRRGSSSLNLPPNNFINFIQNHDQIANSGKGERVHNLTSPGNLRAMTALLLLAPQSPMLFQGQEFSSSTPFYYFADHKEEIAKKVCQGRAEFLSQFRSLATPEMQACLPDPTSRNTFMECKLNFEERKINEHVYQLHKDLIKLRREEDSFNNTDTGKFDGAVLSSSCFVLRYFLKSGEDRIFIINFGNDLHLDPAPEPLLAPPEDMEWDILWSSEDPVYGGTGTAPLDTEENWIIPGKAAVILKPKKLR